MTTIQPQLASAAQCQQRLRAETRALQRHCRRVRPSAETIHAVRLCCKRLVAWQQLLEDAGVHGMVSSRRHLRRLSGRVAPQRDATVMAAGLAELAAACTTTRQRDACLTLAGALQQAPPCTAPSPKRLERVDQVLLALVQLPLPEPVELMAALRRQYRRCRRLARAALASHGDEAAFHALRKRVKQLQYQLAWLSSEPHPQLAPLKLLGSTLGRLHDLQVLQAWLERRRPEEIPAATKRAVLRAITGRSARCLRELQVPLRRLFARPPRRWSAFADA
jgi:CHAD domain-containing protein